MTGPSRLEQLLGFDWNELAIKKLSDELESLRAQLAAVTAQRDELLRAAEPCCVPFYGGVYHDALRFTVESVRSAIRNENVDALDRELAIARAQPEQGGA